MTETSAKIRKAQSERVRLLRKLLNLSRTKLAEHHPRIPKSNIRNWEEGFKSGLTETGAEYLAAVAQKLGIRVTTTWLLEGVGNPPEKIPIEVLLTHEPLSFERSVHVLSQQDPHTMTALVKDDAFAPTLHAGEYVIGTRFSGKELTNALNALCIVETLEGEIKIGYLKHDKLNKYALQDHLNHGIGATTPINVLGAAPIMMVVRKIS